MSALPPQQIQAQCAVHKVMPTDLGIAAKARWTVAPTAAAFIGTTAFSGHWQLLSLAAFLPFVLSLATTRWQAFATALTYQLAASRGLLLGAADFFGTSLMFGEVIWLFGNLVSALTYGLLWSKVWPRRICGAILAMALLAVPPLGTFGWTSPITSAGALYPGLGALGILLTLGLMATLAARRWRLCSCLLFFSLAANLTYRPTSDPRFEGLTTSYGPPSATLTADYERQLGLLNALSQASSRVVVLPESSLTQWNEVSAKLWTGRMPANKTALLGSTTVTAGEQKPSNTMVILHAGVAHLYRQRQPVPLSMWRPWSSGGYAAHWFEAPVVAVSGAKVAPLICYEAFLVWPVVQSMLGGADHIVVLSNLWWAVKTSIPQGQRSIVAAWARLFSAPYVLAVNT